MEIDLSRIESEPLTFDEEFRLETDNLDATRVAEAVRVHLRGSVRRHGSDHLWAVGEIGWSTALLCGRCLEAVPWEGREEFGLELCPSAEMSEDEVELGSDDLDVVFLEEERLNLSDLAVEQIELAMPMRILCREGCAGLCPRCGADLNLEGGCGCEPEPDPRFSALADLKGRDSSS